MILLPLMLLMLIAEAPQRNERNIYTPATASTLNISSTLFSAAHVEPFPVIPGRQNNSTSKFYCLLLFGVQCCLFNNPRYIEVQKNQMDWLWIWLWISSCGTSTVHKPQCKSAQRPKPKPKTHLVFMNLEVYLGPHTQRMPLFQSAIP